MNAPVIVAVTQRVDAWPERGERRDAVDQRLMALLHVAGAVPVAVPNALLGANGTGAADALAGWVAAVNPRAVLLSGGNDIGEYPDRDRTERRLLDHARTHGLPALGICRGMQMMAVWAGGALVKVDGHVRTRHVLSVSGEAGLPSEVNSYHNLALAGCPSGFAVMARAEDGTIEAMRHETLRWEGWMWHPERERVFSPVDVARIKDLFHV